jgi:transcriptional regulator with PAS, ATPase and Fis domain
MGVCLNKNTYSTKKIIYPMADILVSWIGKADIDGSKNDEPSGPLASVLKYHPFECVYLLYNQPDEVIRGLVDKYESAFDSRFIQVKAELTSPIHFADIYKTLDSILTEAISDYPNHQLNIQLTSGTPAMTSVSILTGKTKYKVNFLQSSIEQGVQFVDIPFDIAADFLPSVSELQNKQLASLMANAPPSTAAFENIITQDPSMERLKQRAAILAVREVPVLIYGETGTGKELFARAIHNTSQRSSKPFVPLNCGALSPELIDSTLFGHVKGAFTGANADKKGVFAEADKGTLFLDEFGELPLDAQVRLLRVLQDGKYIPVGANKEQVCDVRIIVATNRNLSEEIAQGNFREDLFYRVAIGVLTLPPLRERSRDIWILAQHIMEIINSQADSQPGYIEKLISPGAKKIILNHQWPGNVRELHATLLRASLWGISNRISEEDMEEALIKSTNKTNDILGRDLAEGIDINEIIKEVSVHYIERAMKQVNGSKTKAAELLSIKNYQTLNNWIEKYSIK